MYTYGAYVRILFFLCLLPFSRFFEPYWRGQLTRIIDEGSQGEHWPRGSKEQQIFFVYRAREDETCAIDLRPVLIFSRAEQD